MVLEQLDIRMQKKDVRSLPSPYIKKNPKWILALNVKDLNIKFLKENIGIGSIVP